MDIEKMTEQQILDYLRSTASHPKSLGAAKSLSLADFFDRHGVVVRCPHCSSTKNVKNGTNGSGITRYKCRSCGKNYALTTNTIFDGTSYSLEEMINAVHAVLNLQSSVYMENNTASGGLWNSAAWLLVRKIQAVLASMKQPALRGVIEIDEKYIREAQKGSRALVSFLDGTSTRRARRHNYRSEAGIFGPEFINVLCAADHNGHYWARCVCLGPMGIDELNQLRPFLRNVAYICSDNYEIYQDWCEKHGFVHYVEPSTYRKERKARGYIDTDNIYRPLTESEYAKDEAINRQMYKEGRYPHIENANHNISYEEFLAVRSKFRLGINTVNSFHSMLENYLIQNATNVSSDYLQDYVMSFTWIMNYKTLNHVRSFSKQDAEDVLALMCRHTIQEGHSPTLKDIKDKTVAGYPRPSKKAITDARNQIRQARKVVRIDRKDGHDQSAFEGDDDSSQYMFNKTKFFRDIGTIRLNELAKLYGVYDRNENKATRIKRMADLPNAQDIIFYEIMVSQYGTVSDLAEAINKLPEKRKRGRPRKGP